MQGNSQDDDQRQDTGNATDVPGGITGDGDDVVITEGGITDVTGTIPLGGSSDVGGTGNVAATADIGATTGAAGLDPVRTGTRAEAAAEQLLSDDTTESGVE